MRFVQSAWCAPAKEFKMLDRLFLLTLGSILFSLSGMAQSCAVDDPSIAKEYVGDCENGRADGWGVAKGTDAYRGMFRKGKMHGSGSYTWADGSTFQGEFVQGAMGDGFGTFTEPLKVYTPSRKRSPVRGKIAGDVYVEQGWWEGGLLVIACPDKVACEQARDARETAALQNIDTGTCSGPASAQAPEFPPRFHGSWSGLWDGEWTVHLHVSAGRRPGSFVAIYQWQEQSGAALSRRVYSACLRRGNLVVDSGFLEMKLDDADPRGATLTGKFQKPRTARLTKMTE
jgi:hypothetical protein